MLNFMENNTGSITGCKVMTPKSFQYQKGMSDPILNDATALANMDILWMTEVYVPNSNSNLA